MMVRICWLFGKTQLPLADDPMRRLAEVMLQRLLEEEISAHLNAEPNERTDGRQGYRNGHYKRTLTTRVGKVELLVPRDRDGQFSTELFDRYQRSEKAFVLSLMEMYVKGVSTRKVKKITQKLCGVDVSKSQVSELAKNLDEQVEAWRSRPIEKCYPYLIVDALFEKVRHGPHVKPDAVLVVTGVNEDGYRQHLGVWMGNTESEATWSKVFNDLKDRGLQGVRYIVSDKHRGIEAAIARQLQGAVWQRCQVHFKRNVCGQVRRKDRDWVMQLLKKVTDAPGLPPNYVPLVMRELSIFPAACSGRAREPSPGGTCGGCANSAGVLYPSELCGRS
jgi:transposase-like protein